MPDVDDRLEEKVLPEVMPALREDGSVPAATALAAIRYAYALGYCDSHRAGWEVRARCLAGLAVGSSHALLPHLLKQS